MQEQLFKYLLYRQCSSPGRENGTMQIEMYNVINLDPSHKYDGQSAQLGPGLVNSTCKVLQDLQLHTLCELCVPQWQFTVLVKINTPV